MATRVVVQPTGRLLPAGVVTEFRRTPCTRPSRTDAGTRYAAESRLRMIRRAAPGIATAVLAIGIWFTPPPDGLTIEAWRLFAIFAAAIFSVVAGALPILTASLVAVAAAVLSGVVTPEKAYAGFSNGDDSADRAGVPGRAGRGEVRSRRAGRPRARRRLRPIDARTVVQHLSRRRGDRAGVSEQHRAVGRPLPSCGFARRGGRREARRSVAAPARKFPDVLGHCQPGAVIGVVADRHGGQSAWQRDREKRRCRDRLWLVAHRVVAADARSQWR